MVERLDDGFSTIISFSLDPTVQFYEKTVKPPGISAGGPNDTTTMRNSTWRTKAPKLLKSLTDSELEAAYDPAVYDSILPMIGVNQQIQISFPDGSQLWFWGWVDEFEPNQIQEGEQPTAKVKIVPSNQNSSGVETAPIYGDTESDSV